MPWARAPCTEATCFWRCFAERGQASPSGSAPWLLRLNPGLQLAAVELLPGVLAAHPAVRLVVVDSVTFHFRQVGLRAPSALASPARQLPAAWPLWTSLLVCGGRDLSSAPCSTPWVPACCRGAQEYADMAARTRQLAQMAQQLMALAGERDVAVRARLRPTADRSNSACCVGRPCPPPLPSVLPQPPHEPTYHSAVSPAPAPRGPFLCRWC